jgi:hypothetical protein
MRPLIPALHFVGFRAKSDGERYWNAVRIWGQPDFVHEMYDMYAQDDIAPGDTVIFAKGDWQQEPRSMTKIRQSKRGSA